MLSGLTLAIIQTGNSFGPSLLGWLRDATGGYAVPIIVCMAIEIVAIVIILLRVRPTRVRIRWRPSCEKRETVEDSAYGRP
jgi:cyanate permease